MTTDKRSPEASIIREMIDLWVEHLSELKQDVKDIRTILLGDGEKPGFKVRLDRLEQVEIKRSRMLWLMLASIIAVFLERLIR